MQPTQSRIVAYSAFALIGFAGNNVCAWLSAADSTTDPATYTILRLLGGAIGAFGLWRYLETETPRRVRFDPFAGLFLVIYAVPFAYAYTGLGGGVGATILFVVAQAVIVLVGCAIGKERPTALQWVSLAIALAGFASILILKLRNGSTLMDWVMVLAGAAWGSYVARGKTTRNKEVPIATTVGNFTIATVVACFCWPFLTGQSFLNLGNGIDLLGATYALGSGIFFSGMAYSVWYLVVKEVEYIVSGAIQLATPMLVTLCLLPRVSPTIWQLTSGIAALLGMAAYIYLEHLKRIANEGVQPSVA